MIENWWDTHTRGFFVLNPHSGTVKVWSGMGLEGETPQNTFRGYFYQRDARYQAFFRRLTEEKLFIEQSMWSPMMDGIDDPRHLQPLQTEL